MLPLKGSKPSQRTGFIQSHNGIQVVVCKAGIISYDTLSI